MWEIASKWCLSSYLIALIASNTHCSLWLPRVPSLMSISAVPTLAVKDEYMLQLTATHSMEEPVKVLQEIILVIYFFANKCLKTEKLKAGFRNFYNIITIFP